MLVLTRKEGEEIMIGDDIALTVVAVRGRRVILGINAPKEVSIRRGRPVTLSCKKRRRAGFAGGRLSPEPRELLPPPQDISQIAREEIASAGGTVIDCVDNGGDLFLRALYRQTSELRPGDVVHGGIALRTRGEDIFVHSFTLRQVCRNGAIAPNRAFTRRIPRVGLAAPTEAIAAVTESLRCALREFPAAEAFSRALTEMRAAATQDAGQIADDLAAWYPAPQPRLASAREEALRRFRRGHDHTGFGLMNAVTSVARDEPNPETRWRLEELGGAIPSLLRPTSGPGNAYQAVAATAVA